MNTQHIMPSDVREGSLRCRKCQQLYYAPYFTELTKKGCHVCKQQFIIPEITEADREAALEIVLARKGSDEKQPNA